MDKDFLKGVGIGAGLIGAGALINNKPKRKNPASIYDLKALKRLNKFIQRIDTKYMAIDLEKSAIDRAIKNLGTNYQEVSLDKIMKALDSLKKHIETYLKQVDMLKDDYKKHPKEIDYIFSKSNKSIMKMFFDRGELKEVNVPSMALKSYKDAIKKGNEFVEWSINTLEELES